MDVNAWNLISSEPKEPIGVLNDKFIMRFDRYLNWDLLSKHYDFNIDLLRIYFHRVNWYHIVNRCKLNETVLREFAFSFSPECWSLISQNQILSESFIHDFADKVDWTNIALYQRVSGKFLSDHVTFAPQLHRVEGTNNDDYVLIVNKNDREI